jgi:tetratricopeptide (TPR) repeat protein
MIVAYGVKAFFSAALLWIAALCLIATYRLWFDEGVTLSTFSYTRDGATVNEAGKNFTQMISQDLRRIAHLYENKETESTILASTDQVGRGGRLDLPDVKESFLEDIEVEAYGLKLSNIYKALSKWIVQPNEITGSVSERDKAIDVFVELRGSLRAAVGGAGSWYIAQKSQISEASFDLACRIYRALAANKSEMIRSVNDSDFYVFTRANERYQIYQLRRADAARKEEALQALLDANELVTALTTRRSEFPYVYKLAGYIYRDQERFVEAETALDQYLSLLKRQNVSDRVAESLLASLRNAHQPSQTPLLSASGRSKSPKDHFETIQPGVSIGPGEVPGGTLSAGTLTCIVRDSAGKVYMLSAGHVFRAAPGTPVIQPASMDGGQLPGNRVGVITRTTDLKAHESNSAYASIAACDDNVKWSPEILGIGQPMGIADSNDLSLGERLKISGRTSGIRSGVITGLYTTASIAVNVEGGVYLFSDLILTSAMSSAGDSGAPVVTDDGRLVGMVFAGSNEATFVMPIRAILTALGVELAK